ncbi:MAG: prolyl oligopeptidase family serine peptidase [Lachnospiraceae bacterium]|nr:prolyl oligopeptidase family serine peptidase [Lachnospiraceae bacterium]
MKTRIFLGICVSALFLLSGCGGKNPFGIEEIVQESESAYTCTYDGVKHDYILDLPEATKNAPLVVMLHGYGNTAESFRSMVHFEDDAVPCGYGVVYVTGAPAPNDATASTGWNSGLGNEGNKDVDFLVELTKYLQREYGFDKKRTFAVGFSNGGFMTHRLAMEAADTYTAAVSVAGMMPQQIWENANGQNDISFFQITGEKDDVVPKDRDGSAKFAKSPAIETVMEYLAESAGLTEVETAEIGKASELLKYTKAGDKKQVWHLWVKDGRHSWPDEAITGIDVNALILEFLDTQK